MRLAEWVRETSTPIYSVLISRHGKLVFELYTSSLGRDEAHYVMSVTKSFTSALVGAAIDRHVIRGPDTAVAEVLPRRLFASEADFERFHRLSVKDVLGMSALDAEVPPHRNTPDARARLDGFWASADRVAFALRQPLLAETGSAFQYNDITPMLAAGMVAYATGKQPFKFANQALFAPLGFRNHQWMHRDATGTDNAAFGLRLRPVDMQKFGVLYLRRGEWNGRQLLSRAWVDGSFVPWIRTRPGAATPNYGWYWWQVSYGPGWTSHEANGWRGQRIAVVPEQDLVVTMTADIEDGSEDQVFGTLFRRFVIPALRDPSARVVGPGLSSKLEAVLAAVRREPRISPRAEKRMVPSVAPIR